MLFLLKGGFCRVFSVVHSFLSPGLVYRFFVVLKVAKAAFNDL